MSAGLPWGGIEGSAGEWVQGGGGFRGHVKGGILWPQNIAKRIDGVSSVSQLCVTCTLCGLSSSSLGTLPPGSSQRNGTSQSVCSLARMVARQDCPHLNTSWGPGFGVHRGRGVGTAGSNWDWGLEKPEEKRQFRVEWPGICFL